MIGIDVPEKVYAFGIQGEQSAGIPLNVKTFLNHEADLVPANMRKFVLTTDSDTSSVNVPEKLVAQVTLPQGLQSAILLFVPGSGQQGEPPFRVLAIDDSRKAFPAGSIKVLNMAPTEVMFELEKEKFLFKPGQTQLIKEVPFNEAGLTGMRAFCRIAEGNAASSWKRIASSQWAPPGKKRVFQVLFLDPRSKEVQLRGFTDIAEIVR